MRASTLFGLTIAILIGMAVVFGVKSAGLFDKKVPAVINQERPRILVAQTNLWEGVTSTADHVTIRYVDDSEMDQYLKNKHKYMPPVIAAAHYRILARNVAANEPLLKEYFKDLELPPSFEGLLRPGMKAVNLQLPKDRAGGGIIRKGDIVDVYLTTTVCADAGCTQGFTASAPLALGLKVVVKRDSIWTVMAPVDESKPVSLTLEANPYRAQLIEFAKNKGYLTLVASGPEHSKKALAVMSEGKDEEQRVIETLNGSPVTDFDLESIFKLAPIPRAMAAEPRPTVEIFGGVHHKATMTVPSASERSGGSASAGGGSALLTRSGGLGYRFMAPGGGPAFPAAASGGCATCQGSSRK